MSDLNVRIVQLEPMKVVVFHGFGARPEEQALQKLAEWRQAHGVTEEDRCHRTFGFNNPSPAPGSPNYGYDLWIEVAAGEADARKFDGGLYAVTRCEVQNPESDIPETWRALVLWREQGKYSQGAHQWLEESIPSGGKFVLDLYLPIAEQG